MVSPRDSLEAVARAVSQSSAFPSDVNQILHEADETSDDADIALPLLEIELVSADNVIVNNTDFAGYVTDSTGNHIGRVYHAEYEMTLDLQIWTTRGDSFDPDDLGEQMREALYPHSSYGPGQDFLDENDVPIDDITYFTLGDGERVDDLVQTPTVRKWSQEVELWGYEEFQTDRDYIVDVIYPSDGDLNDTDGDGVISNT